MRNWKLKVLGVQEIEPVVCFCLGPVVVSQRLHLASHSNFANNQPAESEMIFKSYHQPDPILILPFLIKLTSNPSPPTTSMIRLHPTLPSNETSLLLGKGI
ncbi:hypothetical protein PCASD_16097 [Puccinia coronata f. sp. avenae]|uniref:Uncharacterized protein n=1 Tax=Puccinia coronata f. sp. avenae TaxID=200324 RepID=A0A2N5TXY3_9BASI|nr:hypothetical protein PCASD_16097 [Puccinia coronata f. sp. avenae]